MTRWGLERWKGEGGEVPSAWESWRMQPFASGSLEEGSAFMPVLRPLAVIESYSVIHTLARHTRFFHLVHQFSQDIFAAGQNRPSSSSTIPASGIHSVVPSSLVRGLFFLGSFSKAVITAVAISSVVGEADI